jgi:hypothetical protein
VTVGQLIEKTDALGKSIAPKSGPMAGATASMTMHGRGLGDDHPLVTSTSEGARRAWDTPFPENGVYICKPGVRTGDGRYAFEWGDTVRTTAKGAVRMGKSPHGVMISQPREVSWPKD